MIPQIMIMKLRKTDVVAYLMPVWWREVQDGQDYVQAAFLIRNHHIILLVRHTSDVVQVFLLLTLNIFTAFSSVSIVDFEQVNVCFLMVLGKW